MYQQYINGKLVDGQGEVVKVLDPSDNTVITELATASVQQCEEALAAASAAFKPWAKTPVGTRIDWMLKLTAAIMEEKETIAEILAEESGKPYGTAMDDLIMFEEYIQYYAEEGKRMDGTTVYSPNKAYGELYHAIERRPMGVVVAHIAWNYPVAMMALKIGPAMVAGDPLIIKPASDTPLSTLYIGAICEKIGLPAGVINFVSGPPSIVAKTLNTSTIPRMITLIGSSETGRRAMAEASATSIKKFSLELGGNAPVIVMPDSDVDYVVANTVGMKVSNAGQICTNYNRIYVHEDIYEEFLSKTEEALKEVKLGCKHEEGYVMGPMISRSARDRMLALIDEAVAAGATLRCGGTVPEDRKDGNYITPALLCGVREDMRVCREEIFGPIISVQPFKELDDALAKAIDTDYGLASYFYGHDARDIAKAFEVLESGDVYINGAGGGPHTPHIGIKQSGMGCDQSRWSMEEYFDLKRISMIP